ncbi:gonadotropin-releasing hormone receptor-like protein, partial [Dinothrombium tinctorium]
MNLNLSINGSNYFMSENESDKHLEMLIAKTRAKLFPEIIAYSVLFLVGAIGNLRALFDLLKRRHLRKAINILMVHLTLADLIVVFISIPIEIFWCITVVWKAGVIGCKLFQFLSVFGLYLSSCLIVCISIDRYYAFTKTKTNSYINANLTRNLLALAWTMSTIFSLPQ